MHLRRVPILFFLTLGVLLGGVQAQTGSTTAVPVTDLNDVMGGRMPKFPAFPKLAKKPGFLRGYVKDANGKPLQGAYVMINPPTVFGSGFTKRSITARTDARGLYEVPVPSGGCTVWCAGYGVDYNGIRLALPLHPVDGSLDSIPKDRGDIENFVLLTYGVANPATVNDNPVYSGGYYGASFTVGYSAREANDTFSPADWLTLGSEIEITLTPDGPLLDGTAGRPLVIRKKLTSSTYFQVNNIPIGRYTVRATLIENGKTAPLRLTDNSHSPRKGGMTPKETNDSATILFRSDSSDPAVLRVPGGNMERLSLLVDRIK